MGVRHLFGVSDFQESVPTLPVAANSAADPEGDPVGGVTGST